MSKIAFLGLGQMGAPMATRLLGAGHDLTVWNRSPDRTRPLVDAGAVAASTPAEAAEGVDVAITMLANPDALEQVLFGDEGLAGALGSGQLLVEMSTVGPDAIRAVAGRLHAGVDVVDAPVFGSVGEATTGELRIVVGATDAAFERVRPLLESLGTVRRVGGLGSGAAMKLVGNSTLGAAIAAVGEALALGEALGLDRATMLDVLAPSHLGMTVRAKRTNIESGTYPPNFRLDLAAKDLRLVTEAAERAGRELKLARASSEWLEEAVAAGAGDLDYSAVVDTILRAARRSAGGPG